MSPFALLALRQGHADFSRFVEADAQRIGLATDIADAANARAVGAGNLVLPGRAEESAVKKAAVDRAHEKVRTRLQAPQAAVAATAGFSGEARSLLERLATAEARCRRWRRPSSGGRCAAAA